MIDALVEVCRTGQGQIAAQRLRKGVWNPDATQGSMPDQHAINLLLARLPATDRDLIAGLLMQQVEVGVFEALKVLERFQIVPFEAGYEGSPYNDFVGRLSGWQWPER